MVGLVLKVICKKNGSSKCIGTPRAQLPENWSKTDLKNQKIDRREVKTTAADPKILASSFLNPLVYILK